MGKSSSGKYKKLIKDGKEYLNSRYDFLRLELLEKISSIVALLILVMISLVLITTVWIYISGILIVLMANAFGGYILPFVIMGGASLLILAIIVLLKNRIILNPLIGLFSKILFNHIEDDSEDDKENRDENDQEVE